MTFATLMSRDAGILAVSDGVLVLSTFLSVAFIKVLHRFRLPYAGGIYALQLLWYVGLLYGVIEWIQVRYVFRLTQRMALGPVWLLCAALARDDHEGAQLLVGERHHVGHFYQDDAP